MIFLNIYLLIAWIFSFSFSPSSSLFLSPFPFPFFRFSFSLSFFLWDAWLVPSIRDKLTRDTFMAHPLGQFPGGLNLQLTRGVQTLPHSQNPPHQLRSPTTISTKHTLIPKCSREKQTWEKIASWNDYTSPMKKTTLIAWWKSWNTCRTENE